MTTATEALDKLAEMRRPCPCAPLSSRVNEAPDSPCRICPVEGIHCDDCDLCHGEGTVLVFRDSLWMRCDDRDPGWVDMYSDDCPSLCDGSHLVRVHFDQPLMALGPVLRDWQKAVTGLSWYDPKLWTWSLDDWGLYSDKILEKLIAPQIIGACAALGWAKEEAK